MMITHENTWLNVRVQDGQVSAKICGQSVNNDGLTGVETFEVSLSDRVVNDLLKVLEQHTGEAGQRILEVAYTQARTNRLIQEGTIKTLVIEGGIGPVGGVN